MSSFGFRLGTLSVTGLKVPDASMEFVSGLNAVVGASDSGKTYVFQLIDFMLGAKDPPKEIPENQGYEHVELEILSRSAIRFLLGRDLEGGDFELQREEEEEAETLKAAHSKGREDTASALLLSLCGLSERFVRKNKDGDVHSLSFRDIARLTLVDEERIIGKQSPIHTGQFIGKTKEESVFKLLLTGVDSGSDRKRRDEKVLYEHLSLQEQWLDGLLLDEQAKWGEIQIDESQLEEQKTRLARAIEETSEIIASLQGEVNRMTASRTGIWSELREGESELLFVTEQQKRLRLLQRQYESDQARLKASVEAGLAFELLPDGKCPVCGHLPSEEEETQTTARLKEFRQACHAEIDQIDALASDLNASLRDLEEHRTNLQNRTEALRSSLAALDTELKAVLTKGQRPKEALSELLNKQKGLHAASVVQSKIQDLEKRLLIVRSQSLSITETPRKRLKPVRTGTASEFCEVVESTLKAWSYPYSGRVSFDNDSQDLVIGSKPRGSMGKGHRAITHAAFVIGLMRYCMERKMPHPGIVVLDTPLNPFRGKDADASERVNEEVYDAFYNDLANDKTDAQFIVFENTPPSKQLKSEMNYVHYSGSDKVGNQGFFPGVQPPR